MALRRAGLAGLAVAAVAVVAAAASTANGTLASRWYWSPGMCKSKLQNFGVSIGDGRTFNVEKAYCVGEHNHCWQRPSNRLYKVFVTVMKSYDGVVRTMVMTVTGQNTWTGSHLRIIERYMSLEDFNASYGSAAWSVARDENSRGCWDVHP